MCISALAALVVKVIHCIIDGDPTSIILTNHGMVSILNCITKQRMNNLKHVPLKLVKTPEIYPIWLQVYSFYYF